MTKDKIINLGYITDVSVAAALINSTDISINNSIFMPYITNVAGVQQVLDSVLEDEYKMLVTEDGMMLVVDGDDLILQVDKII